MTREEIVRFAASFDPQPMHLDDRAGRESIFGELIASGWHTLSLTMRLMVEARPFGSTPLIGVEVDGIRLSRPVTPGMRLRAEAEVLETRPSRSRADRGYAVMAVRTLDEDDREVARQQWLVLLPRKQS